MITGLTTSLTETTLALLPQWGPWLVGLTTFLSCLALPVPASVLMIAAGAFVGAGDLSLGTVAGAAWGGAIAGDQLGYRLGRRAGRWLPAPNSRKGRLMREAAARLKARGTATVFLTRWLFSPLGPWVNLAAGAAGYDAPRFGLAAAAGEAVWVGVYVGLGLAFGANLQAATALAGDAIGVLSAAAVAAYLGARLWRATRRGARARPRAHH